MKLKNIKVMCHLTVQLSVMFDQNRPIHLKKIRERRIPMKSALTAGTLRARVKVIANSKDNDPGSNKDITTENILAEVPLLIRRR